MARTSMNFKQNVSIVPVELTYADSGLEVELFALPANCTVLNIIAEVVTAFAVGATTVKLGMNNGSVNDDDYFAVDFDVSMPGTASPVLTNVNVKLTDAYKMVTATVGAGNTSGLVRLLFEIFHPADVKI